MLKKLSIKNFAIIDFLVFEPEKGMNILTGETGAGKSILVGALGLLLGERAKHDGDEKCVIEGEFEVSSELISFFEQNDLDFERITIVRREITSNGRSRSFVNDTPVNLQVLKELGDRLVDIHSQHQTLKIGDRDFQYRMLDLLSDTYGLFLEYRTQYRAWRETLEELEALKDKQAEMNRDREFKQFQLDELMEAGLSMEEEKALEEESELLENAEELLTKAARGFQILEGGEISVADLLAEFISEVKNIQGGAKLESIRERLNSALIEVRELANDLSDFESNIALDPERLEEVNNRLDLLNNLKQKHRVGDLEGLIAIRNQLDDELQQVVDTDLEIGRVENRANELEKATSHLAESLFKGRTASLPAIQERLNGDLQLLGMPNARFELVLDHVGELNLYGSDRFQMLFAANKGSGVKPVDKVASGGELSRIMLILKSYLAERSTLPTLIFDEIDTGVSGEIARKVGEMMRSLSSGHQLITITHLPQIAAKGDAHFYVYKEDDGGVTKTHVKVLDAEERVEEVARMLSGDNPTAGAITNARELIRQ